MNTKIYITEYQLNELLATQIKLYKVMVNGTVVFLVLVTNKLFIVLV